MSETEYNWTESDDSFLAQPVPGECFPNRVALTGVGVILKEDAGKRSLLLCNPHPETWNNWLLPYGSFVRQMDAPRGSEYTFSDLTRTLVRYQKESNEEYGKEVREQISELLGKNKLRFGRDVFFSNYSLKFSKSVRQWTVYRFAYHRFELGSPSNINADITWLPLDVHTIGSAISRHVYKGLPVAGNVIALLNNPSNVELLLSE